MRRLFSVVLMSALLFGPLMVRAQMLDAAQIRPILNATKGQWIAVREWQGQDLVYFTHLLTWRCGLSKIQYSVNSAAANKTWTFPPCDEASPNPAALPTGQKIYVGFDLNSVQSVTVKITYDDGKTDTVTYDRAAIKIQ
jgi:hypothetical protein